MAVGQFIHRSSLLFLHGSVLFTHQIAATFLRQSCEGLEQLLEALWRNLNSNVEQMGAILRPAWQEITTVLGLLERIV